MCSTLSGRAVARFASLHVDDGAERALEGAAAAGIEARHVADGALHEIVRQEGRGGDVAEARQVLHVVVERLQPAARGVLDDLIDMLLGFAGEDRDAKRLRLPNILGDLLQHRQAPGDVEAADHHLDARRAQRPGDIDRAGEFVGLHADDADQPEPAMRGDAAHQLLRHDAGVGLVDGNDVDRQIGAEHAALGGAVGQAEHRGKRIRRHGRAQPLHDVTVGVVMRRFDQDQLKAPCRAAFGVEHPSVPGRRCQAEGSSNGPLQAFRFRLDAYRPSRPRPPRIPPDGREDPFGSRYD